MSVQKVCPSCSDQTDGRPTPHTVKDGNWVCGLCGHKTPKKTYNTKKNKDMEDLIKRLGEDAPVNAVGGGNIAGIGIGPQGEPGVRKKTYQQKNAAQAPKSPVMGKVLTRKIPSFKQFISKD